MNITNENIKINNNKYTNICKSDVKHEIKPDPKSDAICPTLLETNSNNNNNNEAKKNLHNRCNYINCSKKLKISDLKCKCDSLFCSAHRLPESHDCSFNYKNDDNKTELIESMRCVSNKIIKL